MPKRKKINNRFLNILHLLMALLNVRRPNFDKLILYLQAQLVFFQHELNTTLLLLGHLLYILKIEAKLLVVKIICQLFLSRTMHEIKYHRD